MAQLEIDEFKKYLQFFSLYEKDFIKLRGAGYTFLEKHGGEDKEEIKKNVREVDHHPSALTPLRFQVEEFLRPSNGSAVGHSFKEVTDAGLNSFWEKNISRK